MRIRVKLYATLRRFAPKGLEIGESFPLELEEGTIKEAMEKLGIPSNTVSIIMVNGNQTRNSTYQLQEDDLLVMFPPIGGGES